MNFSAEIKKFTSQASEWWNPTGSFKLLHTINPIRLNFIKNNIGDSDFENTKILDVGCGGGILCESLTTIGFLDKNITGLDAGYENIGVAKNHASANNTNINYYNSSLEDFETGELFDIVVSFEVIEHCEDYKLFLYNLSKLTKPGGLIFLSTINRTAKSYLQAIIGAEYILKWIPKKTHEWKKFLKPSEIDKVLLQNNCETKKIAGIKFDILNQKWYEDTQIDVNYMLVAQKTSKKFTNC
jgi:2-polyprenyl-6-hydroxyphenyl methylase/3-demethylubiquinone-9 3-methyltransferase